MIDKAKLKEAIAAMPKCPTCGGFAIPSYSTPGEFFCKNDGRFTAPRAQRAVTLVHDDRGVTHFIEDGEPSSRLPMCTYARPVTAGEGDRTCMNCREARGRLLPDGDYRPTTRNPKPEPKGTEMTTTDTATEKKTTRAAEARAEAKRLNNHRGKGTPISDADYVAYLRAAHEEHPESSISAEQEYAYWIKGYSVGLRRTTDLWNRFVIGNEDVTSLVDAKPAPAAKKAETAPTAPETAPTAKKATKPVAKKTPGQKKRDAGAKTSKPAAGRRPAAKKPKAEPKQATGARQVTPIPKAKDAKAS